MASDGSVYVADTFNSRIQKFTSDGVYDGQWGTHGTGDGQFSRVYGVAVASDGAVYVADTENHRIQKFFTNAQPVAVDDAGDAANGGTVEIDVASNDTDANRHTLTVDSVTQGTNGTVEVTAGGVTYTHDGSATTSDTFTYAVSDGNGGTATGTVTVTIAAS